MQLVFSFQWVLGKYTQQNNQPVESRSSCFSDHRYVPPPPSPLAVVRFRSCELFSSKQQEANTYRHSQSVSHGGKVGKQVYRGAVGNRECSVSLESGMNSSGKFMRVLIRVPFPIKTVVAGQLHLLPPGQTANRTHNIMVLLQLDAAHTCSFATKGKQQSVCEM